MSIENDFSPCAKAKAIAKIAHASITSDADDYYETHVLKVAEKVAEQGSRLQTAPMIEVALLHDVLEDCPHVTEEDLLTLGISEDVVEAVKILTRDKSMTYAEYIESVKKSGNSWAIAVKIADLKTNLNGATVSLASRYTKALESLSAKNTSL